MISIRESIIGRKDISNTPILRQGDIIITRFGDIYMVLTDQDCLKKILNPNVFKTYDMSKGVCVCSAGRGSVSFMNLSSLDNNLKEIKGHGQYDIVQIWRNYQKRSTITSSDDIIQIIQIENLKLLKKSYKLIWRDETYQ